MDDTNENGCLDLAGLGKVAESIPAEVYIQTSETINQTFRKLVAPITEGTDGFGRYLRQKFDSMVAVEKAVAAYTLQKAVQRASGKCDKLVSPSHPKSFVRALDEAARETHGDLHAMWVNLISGQIVDGRPHPRFVEYLSNLSFEDARILKSLYSYGGLQKRHGGGFFKFTPNSSDKWVTFWNDAEPKDWSVSCTILLELGLIDVVAHKKEFKEEYRMSVPHNADTHILYLTTLGEEFLAVVDPEHRVAPNP